MSRTTRAHNITLPLAYSDAIRALPPAERPDLAALLRDALAAWFLAHGAPLPALPPPTRLTDLARASPRRSPGRPRKSTATPK